MPKRGKNYKAAVASFDKTALHEVDEALKIAVEASKAKFEQRDSPPVQNPDNLISNYLNLYSYCARADFREEMICAFSSGGESTSTLSL